MSGSSNSSWHGALWSLPSHPWISRTRVETPHWGSCTGTWSQWPSCSLLDYLLTEVDWGHLANFIHSVGHTLWACILNTKTSSQQKGAPSAKDYNCPTAGCGRWFTNKESVHMAIFGWPTPITWTLLPLGQAGWLLLAPRSLSKLGSLPETSWQCPWCWLGHDLWIWLCRGQLGLILLSRDLLYYDIFYLGLFLIMWDWFSFRGF